MTSINFDPVLYKGGGDEEFWAKPEELYWIIAKEGMYAHKPMIIGEAIMPHTPTHIQSIGNRAGYINYTFPKLPARIIAQAVDFFRRTWERQHTEAAVIIVHNPDTADTQLFVPPQKVSGGGVSYGFDPGHIKPGYVIVGSIHSHCNFSAFHSGTDTHDASEFDGLHITIGHVDRPEPEYASMVTVSKSTLTKDPKDVADLTDLKADTAPTWWDRYIIDAVNPENPIVKTWVQFRPPERAPVRSYQYTPPARQHGGGFGLWGDEGDYTGHGYRGQTPVHRPQQNQRPAQTPSRNGYWAGGKWVPVGGKQQTRGRRFYQPEMNPDNEDDQELARFLMHQMAQQGSDKRKGTIDDPTIMGVLNDFYAIIEELELNGLYASDLAEVSELIRGETLDEYIDEIAPLELLPEDKPTPQLTTGITYLCTDCGMPGGTHQIGCSKAPEPPAQVPGQTTVEGFINRRYQ